MNTSLYRVYVERKEGFKLEAQRLFTEIKDFVGIKTLEDLRYFNRYDIEGLDARDFKKACMQILGEPQSDNLYFDNLPENAGNRLLAVEYLPGQYDQRADSALQCINLITKGIPALVRCARIYAFKGDLSEKDFEAIKKYIINPVDSREASFQIPKTLKMELSEPGDIPVLSGFSKMTEQEAEAFREKMNLAMDKADILFTREYFASISRDPTETEIKVLDTYWSDHCRHTTFNTILDSIEIEENPLTVPLKDSLKEYKEIRAQVYAGKTEKPVTLMDLGTIGAKILKKRGFLDDIEKSEEINACSIHINVNYQDGTSEPWLLMFKNETHNHPTEIEPFGGAATCIGGAIRDPLSGRSWVYQAMRVTGAGDPHTPLKDTIPGKLPQIKLTREAAAGYSSYGNQIGLTTGQVSEIYHPGYTAKRMELGAVIAAVPKDWVVREEPEPGDAIILLGGGTGRDGIGGATGSSKAHTETSLSTAGAEVQKGNAVEERKIQRLFRNPEVTKLIRRCNDFGAGGVSVAIGELAPGLEINLDLVPKKYEGLNGTEIAISESQERMACVVREKDVKKFIEMAGKENLQAVKVAEVTDKNRLTMKWRGKTIVDLDRDFLDTNGAKRNAVARITAPAENSPFPENKPRSLFNSVNQALERSLKEAWTANLSNLGTASQKGLEERFDGSIGSASVLFPYGGKYQLTPEAGMAAKIPSVYPKESTTASLMTFGFDPRISSWSPYHGAQFAVLDSLAKILALGGDPLKARLTFQEYFERTTSPESWGKPASALLGALTAQIQMGTPSIGGKDSMSGSFGTMNVPPTLVSFAVGTTPVDSVLSGEFKAPGNPVYVLKTKINSDNTPDWESFKANIAGFIKLNNKKLIAGAYPVGGAGISAAVSKMAFGNFIGISVKDDAVNKLGGKEGLFAPGYGSIVVELDNTKSGVNGQLLNEIFKNNSNWIELGLTSKEPEISILNEKLPLKELATAWESKLEDIFPVKTPGLKINKEEEEAVKNTPVYTKGIKPGLGPVVKTPKPLVVLPVFPGTNCEYDMARAFRIAGAETKTVIIRNRSQADISESLKEFSSLLEKAQILALSGGFSAGDEPDGSGKFIANILREERIAELVMNLLENKKGLVLGICNGFQALIKTGLLPYGKIKLPTDNSPTLTFNTIGRHISRVVSTKVVSNNSPWATGLTLGGIYQVPVSHGEGRIVLNREEGLALFENGQVFTQYTDLEGNPTMEEPWNPNGSKFAIEGLTSPDGLVLGKMGHSERTIPVGKEDSLLINIPGNKNQNLFQGGVNYFR